MKKIRNCKVNNTPYADFQDELNKRFSVLGKFSDPSEAVESQQGSGIVAEESRLTTEDLQPVVISTNEERSENEAGPAELELEVEDMDQTDRQFNYEFAIVDESSQESYCDPSDKDWTPNRRDRELEINPAVDMVTGSMMRHGISNVTMTNILRDMTSQDGLYREATEAQLRLATNKRRRSALLSVQDLKVEGLYFDGKVGDSLHYLGGKNVLLKEDRLSLVGYPGEKSPI
ncbi:uncharacterized protein LOC134812348 [Bolinopsis microptera]|uniref:uncharacterized protein LOC134812348 n=1 Tax=Bolinopsis microptera TaxID=2820187 RepID=UPI00307A5A90